MAPDLRQLLEGKRPGLGEQPRGHLDLADVVERRGAAERPDPLAIPAQLQRDGLGERRDAGAVAESLVAFLECAGDRGEHAGRIPRQRAYSYLRQIRPIGLPVRENVRLGAYMLRDTALVERRLREVEEMFPIVTTRARDRAGSLSGGQQRLVEFARCLMLDPRLIMLDEPSMGLDPKTFKQVIETIKTMQSSGRTILLVEQNARTGLSIADNGVVLESGRVRLEGSHEDILNNPEIGHLYLGGTLSNA